MKKIIIACMALACAILPVKAQDSNLFNHVAVGINAGTPGIGLDVAVPVGNFLQLRAGYSFLPKISYTENINIGKIPQQANLFNIPNDVDITGKLNIGNTKILADIYPIPGSSLHLTAGAYFGSKEIVQVESEEGALSGVTDYNKANPDDQIGYALGDYLLTPDENGQIKAAIQTKGFKPYLGIGFGRAVPKNRVGFMFEAGAQFWGSPKVTCNGLEVTEDDLGGNGAILKTMSKITIYPVINFRICGRIL